MLAVMDAPTVAVAVSGLVAVLSAAISAWSSSKAADRAASATEAAAARVERAEARTRALTQLEDRRKRLSAAVDAVLEALADLLDGSGGLVTADISGEAARRAERALHAARLWAGPELTAALDAVRTIMHKQPLVDASLSWMEVNERPLGVITDAAQRDLRATYPDVGR